MQTANHKLRHNAGTAKKAMLERRRLWSKALILKLLRASSSANTMSNRGEPGGPTATRSSLPGRIRREDSKPDLKISQAKTLGRIGYAD